MTTLHETADPAPQAGIGSLEAGGKPGRCPEAPDGSRLPGEECTDRL